MDVWRNSGKSSQQESQQKFLEEFLENFLKEPSDKSLKEDGILKKNIEKIRRNFSSRISVAIEIYLGMLDFGSLKKSSNDFTWISSWPSRSSSNSCYDSFRVFFKDSSRSLGSRLGIHPAIIAGISLGIPARNIFSYHFSRAL